MAVVAGPDMGLLTPPPYMCCTPPVSALKVGDILSKLVWIGAPCSSGLLWRSTTSDSLKMPLEKRFFGVIGVIRWWLWDGGVWTVWNNFLLIPGDSFLRPGNNSNSEKISDDFNVFNNPLERANSRFSSVGWLKTDLNNSDGCSSVRGRRISNDEISFVSYYCWMLRSFKSLVVCGFTDIKICS